MDKQTLKAEVRKTEGRKVKNLRLAGTLPANIFGKKVKSVSIELPLKAFEETYKKVGETGLIELTLGKETRPVLVHNVQLNPVTDVPIHVDFLQVDLKEKVTAKVPVEMVGEAPAQKQGLGTVVLYINEIEVEALPADLPDKFEVSIEDLAEVDQAIYVKDLKIDKSKVDIKVDGEEMLIKVEPPQKEEVVEAPAPAEGELPAEGAVPAEGEAPAEGGQAPEGVAPETPKEEPQG